MVTFRDSTSDDPMYREGSRSYSAHWAREFRPKDASPRSTAEPPTSPTVKTTDEFNETST
jgi:hypothetical protein